MSKITIVSRPDQHLLIDVSGCLSFKEAIEQLSAALLSANQFWQGTTVDLNLGNLLLSRAQLAQIMALTKGVGICAKRILAEHPDTSSALKELEAALATPVNKEEPSQVSSVSVLPDNSERTAEAQATDTQADIALEEIAFFEEKNTTTEESTSALEGCEMITANTLIPQEKTATSTSKHHSLCLKQTLRAGQAVSHKGNLIIIGDVNAGAEVLAEGDITVWGSLRGIAHAGIGGNTNAEIRALRLQPIQLRIAHYIARSPDALLTANSIVPASPFMAETAKLVDGKIRILREIFD